MRGVVNLAWESYSTFAILDTLPAKLIFCSQGYHFLLPFGAHWKDADTLRVFYPLFWNEFKSFSRCALSVESWSRSLTPGACFSHLMQVLWRMCWRCFDRTVWSYLLLINQPLRSVQLVFTQCTRMICFWIVPDTNVDCNAFSAKKSSVAIDSCSETGCRFANSITYALLSVLEPMLWFFEQLGKV